MTEPWKVDGKPVIVKTPAEYMAEACGNGKGILCPECGCPGWKTKRTTKVDGNRIKRERECLNPNCRYPMTTYELPEVAICSNSGEQQQEES